MVLRRIDGEKLTRQTHDKLTQTRQTHTNPTNSQKPDKLTQTRQTHTNPTNSHKPDKLTKTRQTHKNPTNSHKPDKLTQTRQTHTNLRTSQYCKTGNFRASNFSRSATLPTHSRVVAFAHSKYLTCSATICTRCG